MDEITRRALFLAGGAGATAAAGLAAPAAAAEPTAGEAANRKLVEDFCASWSAKDFDPDTVTNAFFAPDASPSWSGRRRSRRRSSPSCSMANASR